MTKRSMADAVRAVLVKRAFVPGDPGAGGMPPPGGMDPAMMGGMPPPGMDPAMMGGMPPGGDPAAGGMPPMDPSMMGGMPPGGDPMAGMPPMDPSMMGGAPQSGMINMTADEFTKFVKQMMAAFSQNGAPVQAQQQQAQQPSADISAKLDTLIAVLQGKAQQPSAAPALVAGV